MTWIPNGGNLLPVDPDFGGVAAMDGWFDVATGLPITVQSGGYILLNRNQAARSAKVTSGVAETFAPVKFPGDPYTAAAGTVSKWPTFAVALQWVFADGTTSDPVWSGTAGTSEGSIRSATTATAPVGAVGAVMTVQWADPDITDPLNPMWTDPITGVVQPWPFGPFWDTSIFAQFAVPDAVIVHSDTDPGPLPPLVLDETIGTQWWQQLPEVYRAADAPDYLLRSFMQGTAEPLDDLKVKADHIAAGWLTDPALCDGGWLPWLTAMAGLPFDWATNPRTLLAAKLTAPTVGSRDAIARLARQWLTGTQVCDVFPSPSTAWTITVRVRADELSGVANVGELRSKLIATGQIPAGFDVLVVAGVATWTAVEARATGGTWNGLDGSGVDGKVPTWDSLDSTAVSGL